MNQTVETRPYLLAVDDDPDNLDTFRRVFRKEFNLVLATSGADALRLLAQHRFDVAVVDYAMPGMNGIEVIRQALRVQDHLVRILLTAHADLGVVGDARTLGLSAAVVLKPWDRDDLLKLINNHLRLASMRRSVSEMVSSVGRAPERSS